MGKLEKRLRELGQFKSSPNHSTKLAKRQKQQKQQGIDGPVKKRQEPQWLSESDKEDTVTRGFVEDDHIPFMARGVEILHMIPSPFPSVWHTMNDDGEHLDIDTTEDWAKLVTAFTAEWMDLEGFMNATIVADEGAKRTAEDNEYAASDRKKRKAEASTDRTEL